MCSNAQTICFSSLKYILVIYYSLSISAKHLAQGVRRRQGRPDPVGIVPAMQTVERPGNEQPLVRWRHKRKIEYACENPDTDYSKGEFPEMSFVQTWPFIRLRRVVYNDSIPPGFSPTCHYLLCKLPLKPSEAQNS